MPTSSNHKNNNIISYAHVTHHNSTRFERYRRRPSTAGRD